MRLQDVVATVGLTGRRDAVDAVGGRRDDVDAVGGRPMV